MDTQTLSHRSRTGFKYYTSVRDIASKYIMGFKQAKKNGIISMFEEWVKEVRNDPIFKNYNWTMISVTKLDNAGEWYRGNKKWMDMCDGLGV